MLCCLNWRKIFFHICNNILDWFFSCTTKLTMGFRAYIRLCDYPNCHSSFDQVFPEGDIQWTTHSSSITNQYVQVRSFRHRDLKYKYSALTQRCSGDHGKLGPGTPNQEPHSFNLNHYMPNTLSLKITYFHNLRRYFLRPIIFVKLYRYLAFGILCAEWISVKIQVSGRNPTCSEATIVSSIEILPKLINTPKGILSLILKVVLLI